MEPLPQIDPADAGFAPERVRHIEALVLEGASRGLYLGASFLILRRGAIVASGAAGRTREEGGAEVNAGTLFDLASLTKPLVTATATLMLAEQGRFHLGEEVASFLDVDAAGPLAGITLRHLLTHTSGLPGWRQYHSRSLDREAILRQVRTAARERVVGSRYVYSDLGFILLGEVVERVAGVPLDQFAREQIFTPLGMLETTYLPPAEWRDRTAATRCPDRARVLVGEVHDGNCAAMGGVAGHAGLFSTGPDVARFAAMLLAGGALKGHRLLGSLAVRRMATRQIPAHTGGGSLGWFTPPNSMLPHGDLLPSDCFGHTGFTGTSLVICRSLDLAAVLLTNRVYHERDAGDFLRFRRHFHNAIAAAITG